MVNPTFADYVDLLFNLFERFWHHDSARPHRGHPFVYEQKALIVFFLLMQQRRLLRFKAQRRWLVHHPEMRTVFGFNSVPARTTLSRRYKGLCRKFWYIGTVRRVSLCRWSPYAARA